VRSESDWEGAAMGYVDRHLMMGEEVVHRARLHRVIFLPPAALLVLGLILAIYIPSWIVAAVSLALSVLVALPRFIRYVTSEFAVTNKRVIVKVGLVHRHTLELVLAKIETVGVDQTILGRIFNFGTIVVTGTGGTTEPFRDIARPLEFRKQVQSALS
jgi:uncharacterized membrane protein YdbT with pleckstrin-like domain